MLVMTTSSSSSSNNTTELQVNCTMFTLRTYELHVPGAVIGETTEQDHVPSK